MKWLTLAPGQPRQPRVGRGIGQCVVDFPLGITPHHQPLLNRFLLRHEAERKFRIGPESGEISNGRNDPPVTARTIRLITKAETKCPICGQEYEDRLDLPFYARYAPMAIVATCAEHDLFFRSPGESDLARIDQAEQQRGGLDFGSPEDFRVKDGPKSGDLLRRQINSYLDVFSSRQVTTQPPSGGFPAGPRGHSWSDSERARVPTPAV